MLPCISIKLEPGMLREWENYLKDNSSYLLLADLQAFLRTEQYTLENSSQLRSKPNETRTENRMLLNQLVSQNSN